MEDTTITRAIKSHEPIAVLAQFRKAAARLEARFNWLMDMAQDKKGESDFTQVRELIQEMHRLAGERRVKPASVEIERRQR